jgi:pseudouridine-5'-phosphate glycosidase
MHGGTTISGTMILSELAGIKIFGTGGLGIFSSQKPNQGTLHSNLL